MSKRCMGCMEVFGDDFEVCPHCGYVEGTKAEEAIHMEPGTLLNNRYIIGRVLGFGGFGITYIGWDGKLEQKVAVKEYLPSEFSTRMPGQSRVTVFNGDKSEQFRDGLDKFVEEAKKLAKFQNEPGIVKVFDSFAENDTAYIVMEFLDGETLTERLKRDKVIDEDEAVRMLWPVMNSLQIVHQAGILHRDIAPDNIFITKSGDIKLIDFGASRYATTSHSRSLTVIIKPGYSPEEQYRSRGDQGPHTDVYALAATMYKMITGKTPPDSMERRAKIENLKKEILEEPHKLNKKISLNREIAILNAMNVRVEDRTADVLSFMNELEANPPAKRRYGKIKKIDLYSWPLWLKILLPVVLSIFLTLGVLLGTGVIKIPSLFSDEIVVPEGVVVVPDVEGLDINDAKKLIEESNLNPVAGDNIESEYIKAGKIILQTPMGGSYTDEHTDVVLTVSGGKEVVGPVNGVAIVPYVVWKKQEEAIAKMIEAGLAEPEIKTKSDDTVPQGQVISQSIETGTEVKEGTKITIYVSTGPASFKMPSVTGQTQYNAEDTLASRGLDVVVQYAKSNSVDEGCVISQSISAGTSVKKGDKVTLTVSSGKPTISVSDVVGKSKNTAVATLEGQGFSVTVLENYSSTVALGTVISQSPAGGSYQFKDTLITIYVSKGKQPVKVTFNANGGTVGTSSKTVYYTSNYGSMPTPTRAYYQFSGWYTAASGGSLISASNKVSTTNAHTLYAHWTPKATSTWVEASKAPSGARIVDEKWTYTQKETTTSTSSSISGWKQTGSTWKESGSGTHYYANYPGGFEQSSSLYSKYNKSALSAYNKDSVKREVSGSSVHTYIYWHWCRGNFNLEKPYNRVIKGQWESGWPHFCAFESDVNKSFNSNANAWEFSNQSACRDTYWWFKFEVYKQTYTDYQKVYSFEKTTNLESSSEVTPSATIINVQKWVKYQPK